MVFYGQMIVGAPGSGKSTYCSGLAQILEHLERPTIFVNLDPANDVLPYQCDVDIRELITVQDAMEKLQLGPNGALRYCMKTLADNIEWFRNRLSTKVGYLVIDMPGQLELYNSDDSISRITSQLTKWGFRLCAVHLSDSMYCSDAGKFVAVILSALSIMVNLEMPQVNVLSKADLIPSDLPYSIDFFQELPDLNYLVDLFSESPVFAKYKTLCKGLCELSEEFNLVNFTMLDVSNKEKMVNLLQLADKANGFAYNNVDDLRDVMTK